MSDTVSTTNTRIVPSPKVRLQSDNWYVFEDATLENMHTSCGLDTMLKDPIHFNVPYQDLAVETEDTALNLDVEEMKLNSKLRGREDQYHAALAKFQVRIQDVKEAVANNTAANAGYYFSGDALLRWMEMANLVRSGKLMDTNADAEIGPEEPNATTYQGLILAKESLDRTITEVAKARSEKRQLANRQDVYTSAYTKSLSSLEREKGSFLTQLFSKGDDGLMDPGYYEQLRSSGEDWEHLTELRSARKLNEIWAFLKQIQDRAFPDSDCDKTLEMFRMDPTAGESLDAFSARYFMAWKHVDINPDLSTEKLAILQYRNVLKKFYGIPEMLRILEPYYLPKDSPVHRKLPNDLYEFRSQIVKSLKAITTVQLAPLKLVARVSVVSSAIEDVVAAATTNSHPPNSGKLPCLLCKRDHNTMYCKFSNQDKVKQLRELIIQIRKENTEKGDKSTHPSVTETSWKKPKGSTPSHQVASTVEEKSDSLFDRFLTIIVGVAKLTDPGVVQFDCGANANILNDIAFFKSEPIPTDRYFVGVYDDDPKKLKMVGESRAYGRAYYDPRARCVLAQSLLEKEGFWVDMIKNGNITTGYEVSKGGHSIIFHLSDGVFLCSGREVIELMRAMEKAIIAISTRLNPLGIPNTSMFPTAMLTQLPEPTIDPEPTAMDIEEYEAPVEPIESSSGNMSQPFSQSHENDNGLWLGEQVDESQTQETVTSSSPSLTTNNAQSQAAEPDNVATTEETVVGSTAPLTSEPFYVPSLGRRLTRQEEARYMKAAALHVASGHAGKATEMKLLQGCHLLNTELTPADVKIYHEISGACLGCVKGKMTMPKQSQWEIRTGALIGEYWEMDLAFFAQKTHVILVEAVTNYVVVYPVLGKKASSLLPIAEQWNQQLIKTFPRLFDSVIDGVAVTIKIKCDRELAFEAFVSVVRPLHLSRTSAEGHACRVEVRIRMLKERARSIIYSLPYRLPSSRYNDLVNFVIDMMNYFPSTVQALSTPMETIFSKRLREEDLLRLQFGQMVAVIVPPSQRGPKVDAVALEGIIVGFESHTPSNVKVYIPATNHIVCRTKLVKIQSPALIKTLNDMSRDDIATDPFPLEVTTTSETDLLVAACIEGGLASDLITMATVARVEGGTSPNIPPEIDMSTLTNMTATQAIKVFGHDHVLLATLAELENMEKMGVYAYVDPAKLDPNDVTLPSKIFYKAKFKDGAFDKMKARLVLRGDQQPAGSYGETKSPTADKASLFTLCALNKYINGTIFSVDVPAAFLFAQLQEQLYMRLPKEITQLVIKARPELVAYVDKSGRLIVQLAKSLYGLKQSPLNWYLHLVTVLEEAGFTGCITDRCVFFCIDKYGTTHLLFHVDDIIVSSNARHHIDKLRKSFKDAFGEMEWSEKEFSFLGMYFRQRDDHSIDVDMAAYTMELVQRHWTPAIGDEFKKRRGVINPSSDELFMQVDHNANASEREISKYKSITMELLYCTTVRIDILKECISAAAQSHAPGPNSWKLIRQLIAYLKENPAYVINLGADSTVIHMYADAGYALHPDAHSHTGIFVTLGSNSGPILVKSKKQSLVTQSSTEAELVGLVDGIKRAIPLAKLLVELRLNSNVFIKAMQDNTSTITIARMGEGMHGKAKHFMVRFNCVREFLEEGIIDIVHVGTNDMIPDFLTKGMTGVKLQEQIVRAMYHGDVREFKESYLRAEKRVAENKAA